MDNKQLVLRLTNMTYEQLMLKVRKIRRAKVTAIENSKIRPAKKATKAKQDSSVNRLVSQMNKTERQALLKLLEGPDEGS